MKINLLFILLLSSSAIYPQLDSLSADPGETLEDLIQENEEEPDNSAASDIIEEKLDEPLNINTAGISEFLSIPYIDLNTVNKILEHRNKFGPFFSTGELYSIKEISPDVVPRILPFLTVGEHEGETAYNYNFSGEKNFTVKMRSRAAKDLQTRNAYKENNYDGSGTKYYNRITGEYLYNYQFGVLTEKDPGEKSINEFTSFFVSGKEIGILTNFIAGDYLIECGQGLALWSPYGFSKGSEAVFPVKKQGKNIRAYKSTDENKFFRGAAGQIMIGNFSLTSFYSQNKLDANIDSSNFKISSTPLNGLHRTENEKLKRKSAEEILIGTKLDYSYGTKSSAVNLNIGAAYYHSKFSHQFFPSDRYDLNGDKFNFSSVYYDLFWNSLNLFGEFSYNGISAASINGFIISASKDFSFISSVRSYPRNFYTLHGSPLTESSGKNELGFYTGVKWKTKIGIVNFYYDQFKFPYAGYSVPMPAGGNEFLFSLHSKPLHKFEARFRIKYENKETGGSDGLSRLIVNQNKKSLRLDLIHNSSKFIRIKGRFEVNNYRIEELNINEQGILFYQDIRIALINKIIINGRIIIFRTDSFNSAVYGYENDLQGISANPALYGEGVKWYLVFRFKILNSISLSCKYSELYKPEEKYLYSGNEKIEGNIDNKLSIQLDIQF